MGFQNILTLYEQCESSQSIIHPRHRFNISKHFPTSSTDLVHTCAAPSSSSSSMSPLATMLSSILDVILLLLVGCLFTFQLFDYFQLFVYFSAVCLLSAVCLFFSCLFTFLFISQNIFRLRPRILSSLAGLALGRHVLVDGLGALRDGVLGELAWQDQPHGSLEKKRNKGRKKGKK